MTLSTAKVGWGRESGGCSEISTGPIMYSECCLLISAPHSPSLLPTRAGNLRTTFPRLPCQLGSGWVLTTGGSHVILEGSKKVEAILFVE